MLPIPQEKPQCPLRNAQLVSTLYDLSLLYSSSSGNAEAIAWSFSLLACDDGGSYGLSLNNYTLVDNFRLSSMQCQHGMPWKHTSPSLNRAQWVWMRNRRHGAVTWFAFFLNSITRLHNDTFVSSISHISKQHSCHTHNSTTWMVTRRQSHCYFIHPKVASLSDNGEAWVGERLEGWSQAALW